MRTGIQGKGHHDRPHGKYHQRGEFLCFYLIIAYIVNLHFHGSNSSILCLLSLSCADVSNLQ